MTIKFVIVLYFNHVNRHFVTVGRLLDNLLLRGHPRQLMDRNDSFFLLGLFREQLNCLTNCRLGREAVYDVDPLTRFHRVGVLGQGLDRAHVARAHLLPV